VSKHKRREHDTYSRELAHARTHAKLEGKIKRTQDPFAIRTVREIPFGIDKKDGSRKEPERANEICDWIRY
jgi:hypothetical protein